MSSTIKHSAWAGSQEPVCTAVKVFIDRVIFYGEMMGALAHIESIGIQLRPCHFTWVNAIGMYVNICFAKKSV